MSGTAQDRKYLVALLIALGSIVVVSVLLALTAVRIFRPFVLSNRTSSFRPTSAAAGLVVPGEFTKDFSISTVVNVPLPPGIYSEPSLQFNVYDLAEHETWEAGIIHAKKYGYRLASYISEASPNRRYRSVYLPPISDGPHHMELSRSGSTLRFLIDDKTVYTFADAPVSPRATLRLAIATAIGRSGELASGSFWDLRIDQGEDSSGESHRPRCSISWGGIALIPEGSRWVLEGRSNPSELGHRVEHCRS